MPATLGSRRGRSSPRDHVGQGEGIAVAVGRGSAHPSKLACSRSALVSAPRSPTTYVGGGLSATGFWTVLCEKTRALSIVRRNFTGVPSNRGLLWIRSTRPTRRTG